VPTFERELEGQVERARLDPQRIDADHPAARVSRDRGVERARAREAGGGEQAGHGHDQAAARGKGDSHGDIVAPAEGACRTVPDAMSDDCVTCTRGRPKRERLPIISAPTRHGPLRSKDRRHEDPPPLAAAVCAASFAFPAQAADSVAKIQKDQAENSYEMAKKQAADEEKSAMAQCGALSGDAKSQCKKNAEAAHDKAMADAKANLDKAKADHKATK